MTAVLTLVGTAVLCKISWRTRNGAFRHADGSTGDFGFCYGGDRDVQHRLKNVEQFQAPRNSFAALTWGNSSAAQDLLKDVQQIQASDGAFAISLGDRSLFPGATLAMAAKAVLCKVCCRRSNKSFCRRSGRWVDC